MRPTALICLFLTAVLGLVPADGLGARCCGHSSHVFSAKISTLVISAPSARGQGTTSQPLPALFRNPAGAGPTPEVIFVQLPATNLGKPQTSTGWWTRVTQPLRSSTEKVASFFRSSDLPRTEPTFKADAISLSRPAKPSPQLYEALARLAEQRGRFDEAEQYYQQALRIAPTHLDSLLGYARLKDRLGEPEAATHLYQRALTAHPREPAVYNDYALFLARRGNLPQAARMMEEAIRLQPRRWLYRTNMAVIMLEMGQPELAYAHLQAVQDPASACYNLGYLAYRKGDVALASVYFRRALEHNPELVAARAWLEAITSAPEASSVAGLSPPAPPPAGFNPMSSPAQLPGGTPPHPWPDSYPPGSSAESFYGMTPAFSPFPASPAAVAP